LYLISELLRPVRKKIGGLNQNDLRKFLATPLNSLKAETGEHFLSLRPFFVVQVHICIFSNKHSFCDTKRKWSMMEIKRMTA